ncbi:LLM class flavin-dependent oxidoreductase [Tsukamurella soli]|uniref:LLM class flavin-dependent oxidoreductase n=1 Tax=Tsukamurella soli TaxID=644556 RepID=A0ABP8JR58_9ACTN
MTSLLHLALEIDGAGAHPAAHLVDPGRAAYAVTGAGVRAAAAVAENAGFTFVTIDDSLVPAPGGVAQRLDAVVRAAFLARVTSRLGIVPLAHPATVEPFHLASQLAALDHATEGRAGWLVGTTPVPTTAVALGRPVADGGAALSAEVADVIEVAQRLWDSWEDDAVIRDTDSGRYIDRDRLHYVDFASDGGDGRAGFSVKGPLIVPRGPQGRPVVVAPHGAAPSALVDIVLVSDPPAGDTENPSGPAVFVDLPVTLDTAETTGETRRAELDSLTDASTTRGFVGGAAELTALLRGLHGRVDGVRLLPSVHSIDVPIIVREVLPPLRVERRTPTPRPGATLREHLGLSRPANRYATTGSTR